jgi:hypothetical protein
MKADERLRSQVTESNMPTYRAIAVDKPAAPPLPVSARLRAQLVYFMTSRDAPHVPPLEGNDYWIDAANATQWLADGVFEVVSPLDEANKTSIELSEEQEGLLDWLVTYQIQHIRLQEIPS